MRPSLLLLVLPLVALVALVASCSDDPATVEATDGPPASSGFTVTRPDGSSFEIDGPFTVECLEAGENEGVTVVRASSPYYTGGPKGLAGMYVEFDPSRIGADGRTYELPFTGSTDEVNTTTLFVYDTLRGRNELSGSQEESNGTVRVTTATCDPEPRLVVTVDATLGSEFGDGEPVEVVGGLDLTGS